MWVKTCSKLSSLDVKMPFRLFLSCQPRDGEHITHLRAGRFLEGLGVPAKHQPRHLPRLGAQRGGRLRGLARRATIVCVDLRIEWPWLREHPLEGGTHVNNAKCEGEQERLGNGARVGTGP